MAHFAPPCNAPRPARPAAGNPFDAGRLPSDPPGLVRRTGAPWIPALPPPAARFGLSALLRRAERALLALAALLAIAAAGSALWDVFARRAAGLPDVLLVFLYAETLAMVRSILTDRAGAVVYPVLIAITGLARLIVLPGQEAAPLTFLYEAGAILVLALALLALDRRGRP